MTDADCAEILAEYRLLRLGPELSAALDHAIGVLRAQKVMLPPKFGSAGDSVAPGEWATASFGPIDRTAGKETGGHLHRDAVLMNEHRPWTMGVPPFPQHPPALPYSGNLREQSAKAAMA